jgi:predicted CXXCH cytochrome family protein
MHIAAKPALLVVIALMLVTAGGLTAREDKALLSSAASIRAKMRPEASSPLRLAIEQPSCLGAGCHEEPSATAALSVHEPYADGNCSFCHGTDPHGVSKSIAAADSMVLCFACHGAGSLQASHRMGVGGTDPRDGSTVTCLTCHAPHASGHPHRLNMDPGPALCSQCHSDSLPNP